MNRALVIFSGGQDSTTCLYWALNRYEEVHTITFNYGQKHNIELDCVNNILDNLGGKIKSSRIIDMTFMNVLTNSALVTGDDIIGYKGELPKSFVPNRNSLFITLSHTLIQMLGGGDIIAGFCETDFNDYPDCRRSFIDKIEEVNNLGSKSNIKIITPLMNLNKSETFKMAHDLECFPIIKELTNTCYNGERKYENLEEWGYDCKKCSACELRRLGYKKFLEEYEDN